LLKEPWAPTCALLVIPGGADLGYCRVLNGAGNRAITSFVRRGGAYLGFCAGGYYGSQRCEFEVGDPALEVVGTRELGFFPGTCRGGALKGFAYHSERGARAVRLKVRKEAFPGAGVLPDELRCYCNGGGAFVDAAALAAEKVEVLATYGEKTDVEGGVSSDDDGPAALVYCKVGEGAALLTGPHPEFAAVNLEAQPDVPGYDELRKALAADEAARTNFLKACLTKLGLEVSQEPSAVPSLSKLHLSALDPQDAGGLVHSWGEIISKEDGEELIRAENDAFHIEHEDTRWSLKELQSAVGAVLPADKAPENGTTTEETVEGSDEDGIIDYNAVVKTLVCHEEAWPEPKETPYFNHHVFYSSLREYRRREREADEWGETLMYGEVVTSTNTLLEK
jgi:biotin--protein ligase